MLRDIWKGRKPSGLIADALEEIYGMLKREEGMFREACDALFSGQYAGSHVTEEDQDINVGERMVRRMVLEHLTLNPDKDLPISLVLIGIVHDVERVGDYSKSLQEFARWRRVDSEGKKYVEMCREIREMIEPMFGKALEAFRESDPQLARDVMRQHHQVKARTDLVIETVMEDPVVDHQAVLFSIAARFLRRVSAHLSNIVSSIANPFDRLGGNEV